MKLTGGTLLVLLLNLVSCMVESSPKRHSFQLKHVIHATFPPKPLVRALGQGPPQKPVLHSSSVADWPLESLSAASQAHRDPALLPVHGAQSFVKSFVPRASFLKHHTAAKKSHKNADPFLKVQSWASHEHQASPLEPLKELRTPDPKDPKTVLALGKMTFNAYIEPTDKSWKQIPGWDVDYQFGWQSTGIRGYVFSDPKEEIQVIVIKGTSLATPVGSGPTAAEDKLNDNMMFSCCCAKASWEWKAICDCPLSTKQCSLSCLLKESNFDRSYYNLAQTIYLAVKEWSPKATIWMAGHSLGGALASLVALTNDLPAFAYEAPGELIYASRIGLLPDIPSPGKTPDYTEFLASLPIYHFGNTQDPIFLGTCRGISSSCYWFDYALESVCHVGYECIYSEESKVKRSETRKDRTNATLLPSEDVPMSAQLVNIKYHSIEYVINNYLETATSVPECKIKSNCLATECTNWEWTP